jgi:hypothetical protein
MMTSYTAQITNGVVSQNNRSKWQQFRNLVLLSILSWYRDGTDIDKILGDPEYATCGEIDKQQSHYEDDILSLCSNCVPIILLVQELCLSWTKLVSTEDLAASLPNPKSWKMTRDSLIERLVKLYGKESSDQLGTLHCPHSGVVGTIPEDDICKFSFVFFNDYSIKKKNMLGPNGCHVPYDRREDYWSIVGGDGSTLIDEFFTNVELLQKFSPCRSRAVRNTVKEEYSPKTFFVNVSREQYAVETAFLHFCRNFEKVRVWIKELFYSRSIEVDEHRDFETILFWQILDRYNAAVFKARYAKVCAKQ